MIHSDNALRATIGSWLELFNGSWHKRALLVYMIVVFGHWVEHILQAYQVFILHWAPADAGGLLGFWYPWLAQSEVLHFVYNFSLLAGLFLLRPAFQGRARTWWTVAALVQGWHFFEHLLLQAQWLTGIYLFEASQQTGILQLWIPRVELHFLYNTLVFLPMLLGLFFYTRERKRENASY